MRVTVVSSRNEAAGTCASLERHILSNKPQNGGFQRRDLEYSILLVTLENNNRLELTPRGSGF